MCTFTVTFTGSADSLIAGVKAKISAAHGTFNGDSTAGSFSVPIPTSHIAGTYTISGQDMTIDITSKPFIISCGQVESFVKSNLVGGE